MAFRVLPTKHNKIMGKEEGITAVGDFQDEDCRYVELNLMPQLQHSVKAGIYEVYAFDNMTIGEVHRSRLLVAGQSRPAHTTTSRGCSRLSGRRMLKTRHSSSQNGPYLQFADDLDSQHFILEG